MVVVVGCAVGQELVLSSIPRSRERVKPFFDRALSSHNRLAGVGVGSNGLGRTTVSAGTFSLSQAARTSRSSHQRPAVGTKLSLSTLQSRVFCPGGSATTSRPRVARPTNCSCVRCATGIGNCQLAPMDMHATGVRWRVAMSSVMCRGQRRVLVECEFVLAPPAVIARTSCLRCRLVSALARILRRNERSGRVPIQSGEQLIRLSPLPPPGFHLWDSLPSSKRVLIGPLDKLVTLGWHERRSIR